MNYRIRFLDGLTCELSDVSRIITAGKEYLIYSDLVEGNEIRKGFRWVLRLIAWASRWIGNEPVMRSPISSVSHCQFLGTEIAHPTGEPELEQQINQSIPPDHVKEHILAAGDAESNRYLLRVEGGRAWVYDSTIDEWYSTEESKASMVQRIIAAANASLNREAVDTIKDSDLSFAIRVKDLSESPVQWIESNAWQAAMRAGKYQPLMAPVVRSGQESYRWEIENGKVALYPCTLYVDGGGGDLAELHMEVGNNANPKS